MKIIVTQTNQADGSERSAIYPASQPSEITPWEGYAITNVLITFDGYVPRENVPEDIIHYDGVVPDEPLCGTPDYVLVSTIRERVTCVGCRSDPRFSA